MMFGKYVAITQTDGVTVATTRTDYYSKDNLGSIVAITDQTGTVTQRLSYDPWGKKRYPNGAADPNGLLNNPDMYHGYTGHEHMDELGIIHMNGRLYDPALARFMSADPHIQDPLSLQSYNRYAYCWNNPLNSTDPSGYFSLKGLFKAAVVVAAIVYAPQVAASAFQSSYVALATGGTVAQANAAFITANIIGGAAGGAFVGATIGAVTGGTLQSTLQGARYGAISGGVFGGIDAQFGGNWSMERVAANSLGGGVSSSLTGGNFGDGFGQSFLTSSLHLGWEYTKEATDKLKWTSCKAGYGICVPDERGILRTDGTRPADYDSFNRDHSENWFTKAGMNPEGTKHVYENVKLARYFVTDVSKLHDWFNSWNYNANGLYVSRGASFDTVFQAYSFAGMPVAGALTAASYLGESAGQTAAGVYRKVK